MDTIRQYQQESGLLPLPYHQMHVCSACKWEGEYQQLKMKSAVIESRVNGVAHFNYSHSWHCPKCNRVMLKANDPLLEG